MRVSQSCVSLSASQTTKMYFMSSFYRSTDPWLCRWPGLPWIVTQTGRKFLISEMTWAVNAVPFSLWRIAWEGERYPWAVLQLLQDVCFWLVTEHRTSWDGPDTFYHDPFVVVPWHGLHNKRTYIWRVEICSVLCHWFTMLSSPDYWRVKICSVLCHWFTMLSSPDYWRVKICSVLCHWFIILVQPRLLTSRDMQRAVLLVWHVRECHGHDLFIIMVEHEELNNANRLRNFNKPYGFCRR